MNPFIDRANGGASDSQRGGTRVFRVIRFLGASVYGGRRSVGHRLFKTPTITKSDT